MRNHLSIQRLAVVGISAAALGFGAIAGVGHMNTAAANSRICDKNGKCFEIQDLMQTYNTTAATESIDLKSSSLYGLGNSATDAVRLGGTFTLTFNGQTTSPAGNVEYEWKVEGGES